MEKLFVVSLVFVSYTKKRRVDEIMPTAVSLPAINKQEALGKAIDVSGEEDGLTPGNGYVLDSWNIVEITQDVMEHHYEKPMLIKNASKPVIN